jgi:hypothetical protein
MQARCSEPVDELAAEEQSVSRCYEFHSNGHESYDEADHDDHSSTKPICDLSASEGANNSPGHSSVHSEFEFTTHK